MRLPYIAITRARIGTIKRVFSELPCPGAFLDLLYVHVQTNTTRRLKMPNKSDAAPNPVRNIGKVQKFSVGTDFEVYAEQLEFFFMANGVTGTKEKKAVLLTNFPTGTYPLTKDLVALILLGEDSLTYDTIAKRLQK